MSSEYRLVETEMGWVGVAGRRGRISKVTLPRPSRAEAEAVLREGMTGGLVESKHDFAELANQLVEYFAGKRVEFGCEIAYDGAGEFDRRVWDAAREIGYGELWTYGKLASRIGKPGAARAVGQALGRNSVPVIVPCHRVIRADGGLGGFSSGLEWKIALLGLESADNS